MDNNETITALEEVLEHMEYRRKQIVKEFEDYKTRYHARIEENAEAQKKLEVKIEDLKAAQKN